jgi:hypothetical protein
MPERPFYAAFIKNSLDTRGIIVVEKHKKEVVLWLNPERGDNNRHKQWIFDIYLVFT